MTFVLKLKPECVWRLYTKTTKRMIRYSGVSSSKVGLVNFQGFWAHFQYMKYVINKNLTS